MQAEAGPNRMDHVGPEQSEKGPLARLGSRLLQALSLRRETFAEFAADTSGSSMALAVLALATLGTALGAYSESGLLGLPGRALVMGASWFAWTATIVWLSRFFSNVGEVSWGGVGRAVALAHAPFILRALNALTAADVLLSLTLLLWHVVAMYVTIRALSDKSNWVASTAVLVPGFFVALAFTGLAGLIFVN